MVSLILTLVACPDADHAREALDVAAQFDTDNYLGAGRYEEAREAIEEGLRIQLRHGMRYEAGQSYRLMGDLALCVNPAQLGEPLAEPPLKEAIALLSAIGADPDLARAYSALGRLRMLQGRTEDAHAAFGRALEIFERRGVAGEPGRVRAKQHHLEQR